MGGERLFPGQANPGSVDNISPDNRSLGQLVTISQPGRMVIGGGFWVQGGVYPERWQLWNRNSGVREVDLTLAALSPSGTGWHYFYFAQLAASPFGPLTASSVIYIPTVWTPSGAGQYPFTNGGFSYPFGQAPWSTSGSAFRNGGTSSQIPNDETFTGGRFYVDMILDGGPRVNTQGSRAAQQRSRW